MPSKVLSYEEGMHVYALARSFGKEEYYPAVISARYTFSDTFSDSTTTGPSFNSSSNPGSRYDVCFKNNWLIHLPSTDAKNLNFGDMKPMSYTLEFAARAEADDDSKPKYGDEVRKMPAVCIRKASPTSLTASASASAIAGSATPNRIKSGPTPATLIPRKFRAGDHVEVFDRREQTW